MEGGRRLHILVVRRLLGNKRGGLKQVTRVGGGQNLHLVRRRPPESSIRNPDYNGDDSCESPPTRNCLLKIREKLKARSTVVVT